MHRFAQEEPETDYAKLLELRVQRKDTIRRFCRDVVREIIIRLPEDGEVNIDYQKIQM